MAIRGNQAELLPRRTAGGRDWMIGRRGKMALRDAPCLRDDEPP